MMKLKVIHIAKDIDLCPAAAEDTVTYPHMVSHLREDECLYIINPEDPDEWWEASEFFMMTDVIDFVVDKV